VDLNDRFWGKVNKGSDGGCWEWTACKNALGYGRFSVAGKPKLAHRVSYEISVGHVPDGAELDHICYNPGCVNPGHLRVATHSDNQHNRVRQKNNTSGFKGIGFISARNKWRARISVNGKSFYLGYFSAPDLAHEAYCDAARKYHGEFSNFGVADVN
jgi:hypothetical protein